MSKIVAGVDDPGRTVIIDCGYRGPVSSRPASGLSLSILILVLLIPALRGQSDTHYVWGSNPSPSNPFTNWAMAATNIQDAVNASTNGDTVLVTNGTYTLTNQISVTNAITVQSVNGATSTIVDGNYPAITSRCFYITSANAVLDGFTITNGYAATSYGGGVYMRGARSRTARSSVIRQLTLVAACI